MKRIWLGVGLLAFLLGLGVFTTWNMERIHAPLCQKLEQAGQTPDWNLAAAQGQAAQEQWEGSRRFTAGVAEHEDVDQIDSLFAQLEVYRSRGDVTAHAATCACLSQALTALREAQRLTWWNLL